MTVYLRGTTYHLRKRVPLQFAAVEPRKIISISLDTDPQRLGQIDFIPPRTAHLL